MRRAHLLVSITVLIGTVLGTVPASDAATDAELSEALAELQASDDEWRRSDAEFRSQRQRQEISEADAEEYASFVADLHRKMLESCQSFRELGGVPESLGFECELPKEELAAEAKLPESPMSFQTEQEKLASLEAELSQSLSEFDEAMQQEQTDILDQLKNQGPSVSYSGASAPTESGGRTGDGSRAGIGGAPTQPRIMEPGAGPGVEKQPKGPITVSAVDSKVGAGDDDVVARQLRDAAENETDPILKEKLWVEYRKYRTSRADPN